MEMGARSRALNLGRIERLTDAELPAWESFVTGNTRATLYHSAKWRRLIQELFGHETQYWLSRDSAGRIDGVLPLVRLRSRLFGDYLVSMPYFNYGGAVGTGPEVEQALMHAVADSATALGVHHIEFRDTVPRDDGWPVRMDKVAMVLDLPLDQDELWRDLGSKLRAQVRRPQKDGVSAVDGGVELVDEFYAVFSRNMRDLGTPVYPRSFFTAIAETFASETTIVVVRDRGRPVAAGFLLGHGDRMEIPWASSVREHNWHAVNMLLYWHCLEVSIARGARQFDFGRSSAGSNTYRFKKQWGARPEQLFWHYWLGERGRLPNLTPHNPKFQLAVQVWRRLPLPVANWLGPHIVKNLP